MKKKKRNIYPIIILIATLFMGIGYASVNSVLLDIDGIAQANLQDGIYITDVSYDSNVMADYENSKIIYAHQTMLNSNIILSDVNQNSSITYEITIYNSYDDNYMFDKVNYLFTEDTYSNEGIVFSLNGLDSGDIIESKDSITFTITFYYKDNQIADNNILKSLLTFNFEKIYYVTYENFPSTIGYPTYIMAGKTLSVSLGKLDAPIEVQKSNVVLNSSEYIYDNHVLTINNVDGQIHIRQLKAYTIQNLVVNGSFENDFYAWGVVGDSSKIGRHSPSYHGTYFAYRKASNEGSNFLIQNIQWYEGHTYYYFGYAATANANGQEFRCDVTNWISAGKFSKKVYSTYVRGSTQFTVDFTGVKSISVNYAPITDNVNVDAIGVIDLTASFDPNPNNGINENIPSKEWCDKNINYFDGSTIIYK